MAKAVDSRPPEQSGLLDDTAVVAPASRWPQVASFVCAVAGLAVALYLAAAHISSGVRLYCAQNSVVNCEEVTTSPASVAFGIPVPYYGVFWFAVMLALLFWNGSRPARAARLLWVAGGVATVLYLLYTELFVIGAICVWCSIVHLLVLTLFGLTVLVPAAVAEPAAEV